jgi:hypothetical protein
MKIKINSNKKRALLYIMALIVCFVCLPSFVAGGEEDKWRLYYTATDGSKYFYDSQSIVRTSKASTKIDNRRNVKSRQRNRKAWQVKVREKIVFNKPDYELNESKILREFECSTKKVHTLMRSKFYKNGTQQIKGQSGIWEDIDSAPFFEILYHIVCPS